MTRSLKPDYKIEPLGSRHDRAAFSCGIAALASYIQRQSRQDLERNLAVVVDAKMGARAFYVKYDFTPLPLEPDRLFLPMKTIEKLFAS